HGFEHLPNPIKALLEWNEVLKDGGIVFMIVPKRDALESDSLRPLATMNEWAKAYSHSVTAETWADVFPENPVAPREHYFVYDPDLLMGLIDGICQEFGLDWNVITYEGTDSKVGNGFTLVYRVCKAATLKESNEPEVAPAEAEAAPALVKP